MTGLEPVKTVISKTSNVGQFDDKLGQKPSKPSQPTGLEETLPSASWTVTRQRESNPGHSDGVTGAFSRSRETDFELNQIIDNWPYLPIVIRKAIMGMILSTNNHELSKGNSNEEERP